MASDEKKRKRADATSDDVESSKKAKKDKKQKKEKVDKQGGSTAAPEAEIAATAIVETARAPADEDVETDVVNGTHLKINTLLVPFANPLANDKLLKKVLKGTKKAAKAKTLKRGVKECVKAINKAPSTRPASAAGIAVFAADIWPIDVISHLPVLCEDHHIPYVYIDSRAELGRASGTKRPTSVVMICKDKAGKAKADAEADGEDWDETYADLLKAVEKASKSVKV